MSGKRLALIVATSQYIDPTLKQLIAPSQDAKGLAEVLKNTNIGNFEVRILLDEPSYKIKQEIEDFFGEQCSKDDFLLLYFSCHGIKGQDGQLYYATSDTIRKRLKSTSVESSFVNGLMSTCRASRQVLFLDCCHSGAFAKGYTIKADNQIHTNEYFEVKEVVEGRGRLVMTASDSMQYSFEPDNDTIKKTGNEDMVFSVFTNALIQGLKTGEADLDDNGHITYDELYDYVSNQVKQKVPQQTPRKWGFDAQGEIIIAINHNISKVKEPEQSEKKESDKQKIGSRQFLLKLLQDGKIEEFNKIRNEQDIPLAFRKADLIGKRLIGADLHDAELSEAKLVKTKLNSANLNGSKLRGADLSSADLGSADLDGANLTQANLTGAVLRGANLKGMVDFTQANLTGADFRGADLKGMVNFEGAIIHYADFTGAFIDNKLINFKEADIRNCKGLPSLRPTNDYVQEVKTISEAINQRKKIHNISPEELKPIEESIKELVKEVEDIKEPEKINNVEKKNLHTKFAKVAQKVIPQEQTRTIRQAMAEGIKQLKDLEDRDIGDVLETAPTETLVRQQALEEDDI